MQVKMTQTDETLMGITNPGGYPKTRVSLPTSKEPCFHGKRPI